DSMPLGCRGGELDGRDTPRAGQLAGVPSDRSPAKVTTTLWGERWSKLAVNCMGNGIAGLSELGSAELRLAAGPRRVAIQLGAEAIRVGRAHGHTIEPLTGIDAQRIVDGAEGRGPAEVEAELAAEAKRRTGGRPSLLQDVMKRRRTEVD